MKAVLVFVTLALMPLAGFGDPESNEKVQTIRGSVIDKNSQVPIPGTTVIVTGLSDLIGTTSDGNGKFRIENVPLGRIGLDIRCLGYHAVVMSNMELTAGKELILRVELTEKVNQLDAVVISGSNRKDRVLNEMAVVSARTFSAEDAKRFAGSFGDPARTASNYAGVVATGDVSNDIVIRGNSPRGLLWKLEGVPVPNPNHFGMLGATSGPISILNNNLLATSDFMTGAFPAEYSNALSGVFDLRMRPGNDERREYIAQVGLNGFEFGAEGPMPFIEGSYILNYRYSTLSLMDRIGLNFAYGAAPQYQDGSFKFKLPSDNGRSSLTIFGIAGKSYIELLDNERSENDVAINRAGEDNRFGSSMSVVGLSHVMFLGERTWSEFIMATSTSANNARRDTTNELGEKINIYGNSSREGKYTISMQLNHKFNAHHNLRYGYSADLMDAAYSDSALLGIGEYVRLTDFKGQSILLNGYMQWKYQVTDALSLLTGLSHMYFNYTESHALEPRIGLRWQFAGRQSLNFGAGLHSQLQPLYLYYYESRLADGTKVRSNAGLDYSRSAHVVLGYDILPWTNVHLKSEVYYQYLFNIPVESRPSGFSALNFGSDFMLPDQDSLVNEGLGHNYGIELTAEKYFADNYFFMFTGSIYNSKYRGSDEVWRNTAFNGNYSMNAVAGKEFPVGVEGVNKFGISVKSNYSGGRRHMPIDMSASSLMGHTIYDHTRAWETRYDDYFRIDGKLYYTVNSRRVTHEMALDVQNLSNRKNVFQKVYDARMNQLRTDYQMGILPVLRYRLTFS